MATRRMLTKSVTEDDNFLNLSSSAQALYLHLSMSADDDGFCNQVTVAMFRAHASVQDLEALLEKRFLYQFDNGVIVIRHWRLANALRKDRYTPTIFQNELAQLNIGNKGLYSWRDGTDMEMLPDGCQLVANRLPQDRLGKDRIDKDSIGEDSIGEHISDVPTDTRAPKDQKHIYGEYKHVKLTDKDIEKLKNEYGDETTKACITYLDEYIEMKGYKAKNHYLCIKKWVVNAVEEKSTKTAPKSKAAQDLESSYEMIARWAESGDSDG